MPIKGYYNPGGFFRDPAPAGGWYAAARATESPVKTKGYYNPGGSFNITPPPGGWAGGAEDTIPGVEPADTALNSRDPFAKWVVNQTKPLSAYDPQYAYGGQRDAATFNMLRDDTNGYQYAWNTLTGPLAAGGQAGPRAPDAWRDYILGSHDRVLAAYNAYELNARQNGGQAQSFYDFARNYNFGNDYYSASPQSRGFYLTSGGPASGRILRSY
jgi:hypothetical protein